MKRNLLKIKKNKKHKKNVLHLKNLTRIYRYVRIKVKYRMLKTRLVAKYALIALVSLVFTVSGKAQVIPPPSPPSIVSCYTSTGALINCGNSWVDYKDGVAYNCTCICGVGGGAQCAIASGSGSSGSIPGQINPGEVSSGNIMEGKAIFTPHQSEAFEDWGEDYKQLLESYGIKSILGQKITPNQIPLTGDKDFDADYLKKSNSFKPKVTSKTGGESDKEKTVQLLNTKESTTIKVKPVPKLEPGEIKADPKHEYIDFTRESLVSLAGLAPKPFSYLGIAIVDIYSADAKQLLDCLDGNCQPTSTVLTNMATQMATDMAVQGVGDLAGFVNGKMFSNMALRNGNMLKGADMGFKEFRKGLADEVIPQIGEGHFSLANTVADAANKWLNASGVQTIY